MTDAVRGHFDRLSARYSHNFASRHARRGFAFAKRVELVSALARQRSGALLDCACGTGEVSMAALASGSFSRAVLVDLSDKMLDQTASRREELHCADVQFRRSDIFDYQPSLDGTLSDRFDTILCIGLVAHTGELPRLLAHLKTMLGRSGRILLQTSLADHVGVRITRRLADRRYTRRAGYQLSYFTLADVAAAAVDSGLMMQDIRRYGLGIPFGEQIFPLGNHYLEVAMERLSERVGAEAICVLGHDR